MLEVLNELAYYCYFICACFYPFLWCCFGVSHCLDVYLSFHCHYPRWIRSSWTCWFLYYYQSFMLSKCIQIIARLITSSISSFFDLLAYICSYLVWLFSISVLFWAPIFTYWMLSFIWDVKDVSYPTLRKVFMTIVLQNEMPSERTWMYSKWINVWSLRLAK